MIRLLTRSPLLMLIFPFEKDNKFDRPKKTLVKSFDDELGWDRVKNVFSTDKDGNITKELQSILTTTMSGFGIGVGIGGFSSTKNTVENFIKNNEATQFLTTYDAKRALQNSIALEFMKKGGSLGVKLGTFCFLFSTLTTCVTAYRGKLAVENYMLGGAITGSLYKINLGFRAMLVGTGLGCILGGICGGLSVLILTLSGITLDEVIKAQHQWITSKSDMRKKIQHTDTELPEAKQLYEETRKMENIPESKF